jgi:hypothetical protein
VSDEEIVRRELNDDDISKMRELVGDIKGKNVLVLNEDLEVVKNVSSFRLNTVDPKDAFILMATTATGSIIQAAEKLQSKAVAAQTFGKEFDTTIQLISL